MSEPVCACEGADPLCGFCEDDLYCPQCGANIARIAAPDADPTSDIVWIYADHNCEFRFLLRSHGRGRDRRVVTTIPQLDLVKSRFYTADYFEATIEEIGPQPDGQALELRLKPRAELTDLGSAWCLNVPAEGVLATLEAEGGFPSRRFEFRICRAPQITVQVVGDGVLDDDDIDQSSWRIWKFGLLQVQLRLEAQAAPLPLYADTTLKADDPTWDRCFRLEKPVGAGAELKPGAPRSMTLTIDSRDWQQGERRTATLRVYYGGRHLLSKELAFHTVALGNVRFSLGDVLPLDDVYLEDHLSSLDLNGPLANLSVENDGAEPLFLAAPEIVVEAGPPANEWIAVSWLSANPGEELILIEPGAASALDLSIDLRRIQESTLPEDRQLKAAVIVKDELRQWRLPIRILNVRHRPEFSGWVAIDFGSTNTFGAVFNASTDQGASAQISPLLNPSDPERFDSVIYFQDLSVPENPQYLIGPEAAKYGEALPEAMVSGMKRWLGERQPKTWFVRDAQGREATYDTETLIYFYLKEVLRLSEDRLRRRVQKFGLSFPANSGRERIDAMQRIGHRLSESYAQQTPARLLCCDPLRLDEASAVALAYVLDATNLSEKVQSLIHDQRSLVIGSFDFGGGTVDTAVIRVEFNYKQSLRLATYVTKYLGIGGDETLGGENVTLTIQELLYGRLINVLGEGLGPESVPRIKLARRGESAGSSARTNFEALWSAAERMKIAICRQPLNDSEHERNQQALRTHLLAQLSRIRGRLDNANSDRLLMDDGRVSPLLAEAIKMDRLLVSLDEVYEYRIRDDVHSTSGGTLRERIQNCVSEMANFALRNNEKIDVIVVAGAGSRLPLVENLIREAIPGAVFDFDRERPKSKVSSGLLRFLTLREVSSRVNQLACPVDYTREVIGIAELGSQELWEIVPAWSPTNDPQRWFPFHEAPLQDLTSNGKILLHAGDRGKLRLLGTFCLCIAGTVPPDAPNVIGQLPSNLNELSNKNRIEIRFAAGLDRIELRVVDQTTTFGYWTLRAATN